MRPAQHAPLGLFHPVVDDLAQVPLGQRHALGRDIAELGHVVAPPHRNVGVHLAHFGELELGQGLELLVARPQQHLAQETVGIQPQERLGLAGAGFPDEGDSQRLGNIVEVEQDLLAALESGRVADELAGKLVNSGVVHGNEPREGAITRTPATNGRRRIGRWDWDSRNPTRG